MYQNRRDNSRSLGAIILIVLGVVFLLGQIFNFDVLDVFGSTGIGWPMFVILPGLIMLGVAVFSSAAFMAIPGAIVTGTGLILWFQSATDRFETWSYLWALYPVFVGLALIYVGTRTGNAGQVQGGRRAVTVGVILTAVFAVFMEGIFTGAFDSIFEYIVPILLIGGGAFLLLRRDRRAPVAEKPKNQPVYARGKAKNDTDISPRLRQQIDEALAADDPTEPSV
jgi:hypothetical protein